MKAAWHNNHHLWEAYFWAAMVIPAYLWFENSVWFVILVSLYANYKTAISAHEGRQARFNTESETADDHP